MPGRDRHGSGSCLGGGYSGTFDGKKLSVVIAREHDAYGGEIRMGDKHFPLEAREQNGRLAGSFSASGNHFDFTATLAGDDLTLVTGSTTYALHRRAPAPVNRLDTYAAPQAASSGPVRLNGDLVKGFVSTNVDEHVASVLVVSAAGSWPDTYLAVGVSMSTSKKYSPGLSADLMGPAG